MKNKTGGFIAELLTSRSNIIEVIFVAILLSLSVNLISSGIPEILNISPVIVVVAGLIIGLASVGYLMARFVGNKNKAIVFNGFLVHDKINNFIVSIPRYQYGEYLARFLKSAINEDESLKLLWDKEPLDNGFEEVNGQLTRRLLASHNLIIEATEYYVLNKLSAHISDYFHATSISIDDLEQYSRNDIPDGLLSNRFLRLFSKGPEERQAFIDDELFYDDKPNSNDTVFAVGKGGAMYNQFKLVLPKNSELRRLDKNCLEINTNRFVLNITIEFFGNETSLPFEFHKYVLDFHGSRLHTKTYDIKIGIKLTFKPISFVTARGWNYYYWADSFLKNLRESFGRDAYFKKIEWESSVTILNYLSGRNELYRQKYN